MISEGQEAARDPTRLGLLSSTSPAQGPMSLVTGRLLVSRGAFGMRAIFACEDTTVASRARVWPDDTTLVGGNAGIEALRVQQQVRAPSSMGPSVLVPPGRGSCCRMSSPSIVRTEGSLEKEQLAGSDIAAHGLPARCDHAGRYHSICSPRKIIRRIPDRSREWYALR